MYKPDLKNAVKFKDDYKMIPVCREIFSDFITPIKALKKLMNESRHCYMLVYHVLKDNSRTHNNLPIQPAYL